MISIAGLLLAQSGRSPVGEARQLARAKRTSSGGAATSAHDPERT